MAKIENFVDALEAYLAKQGKGGNYLANKLTSLFENKTSPLNLNDGPLKDFKDKLKDFNKNTKKLNEFVEKLTDKVKDLNKQLKIKTFTALDNSISDFANNLSGMAFPSFQALDQSIQDFANKISSFSLPKISSITFPSLTGFKKTLDSLLIRMRDFRDSIKVGVMNTFINNIKNMNALTRKINTMMGNVNNQKSTRGKTVAVDVNVIGLSSTVISQLKKLLNAPAANNAPPPKDKVKEEGSIVGKVIKGIIGTVALLAGIGFLSKFLDTPMGKAVGNALGNMKNAFIEMLKPFLEKLFDYSMEGLRAFFIDLPKYFLKQTFNFFGLKEKLGEENEGLAVLLTKGIYYGVTTMFVKMTDKFTFGAFSKLTALVKPIFTKPIEFIGKIFSDIGTKIFGNITRPIEKTYRAFLRIGASSGSALTKVIDSVKGIFTFLPKQIGKFFSGIGFGAGGGVGKVLGSVIKLGGGSVFKLLGAMFKNIAKKSFFIGGLISFKDAYDRLSKGDITGGLISIGSGIASFFPGIGTAIFIGLDVLNAFLDREGKDGKATPKTKINNWFSSVYDKLMSGVDWFLGLIGDILSALNPVNWNWAKGIWNWFTGEKEKLDENIEKGTRPVEYNPIANTKTSPAQSNTTRWNMPQKVNDARVSNNKVVIPSSDDDVVMAKRGGPFDEAFKEMNEKLDVLISVFAQGTQLIANTTIQGSASVANAVAASSGKTPVVLGGSDPIADFRERANKSVR
jgi:hypothetical protein